MEPKSGGASDTEINGYALRRQLQKFDGIPGNECDCLAQCDRVTLDAPILLNEFIIPRINLIFTRSPRMITRQEIVAEYRMRRNECMINRKIARDPRGNYQNGNRDENRRIRKAPA